MHQSKLIKLFQILSEGEIKRLAKFLKSPFFNANPSIIKLYTLLRKVHPNYTSAQLTNEKVFKKVFPKRTYDHQKLLNLMSDFTGILQRYLQILQLEKKPQEQDRLLLKAYAERPNAYGMFVKQVQKANKYLEVLPYRNAEFYQKKFQLNQLYFNHPETDLFQLSKTEYDTSMQHLDRWFLLEKLLLSCEMKAREKPLSETYHVWLLAEIREGIHLYPVESPITAVYLEMLDLLDHEQESSYYRLKDLFFNNFDLFSRPQQKNILQSLINYTIRKGNRGALGFITENLELYKFGLSKNLFLEYGILNDMIYISIVNIALRTGENTWCINFIETYQDYLPPGSYKDAQSLATALWLYAENKPKETISILREVDFLNVYYQIQARVLLIRVFFEAFQNGEDYLELIFSQSEAFERYLRRNKKVSNNQKEALLNFILMVKKLTKHKTESVHGTQENEKLKQEINSIELVYNKTWLLEQIG